MIDPTRSKITAWVLLALILVVAASLRAWRIDSANFWLDEHLTVELSNGHGLAHLDLPRGEIITDVPDYISLDKARPWTDIWTHSSQDVHPPLFYMLLRLWREIFGESDVAIRALPALLSVGAIVALFMAVEAQAGVIPALWASLLMALAAIQIEFAQETRSYSLLELCLLSTCAAMLRIERHGRNWPRIIALATFALASAMTHYLALPLLGVIGLYGILRLKGPARRWAIGSLLTAAAVFVVVWGPFAWAQSGGFIPRTSFVYATYWSLDSWALRITTLPLKYFVNAPARSRFVASMGTSLFILPLLLIRKRPDLLIWWLWLALGVGSIAIADLARHGEMLDYLRYTVAVSPATYALAALMLMHLDGWFRHIVPMLLSIACIGAIQGAYIRYNPRWRDFANFVQENIGDDDVLIAFDNQPDPWLVRCNIVGIQFYARNKPKVLALLAGPPSPEIDARIRASQEIWFFTPHLRIAASLVYPGSKIAEVRLYEQIGTLVRIEPAAPTSSPAQLAGPATAPAPPTPP